MNHCSIPVRRSLYLLFGSFLFGQCSIIFFFQCGMIFSFQTVWSSKSVNNYMLVDADFVTSLNYWWSPWKSYLKIWNTPEVSVLKHQSKRNQRSKSCYYDWHIASGRRAWFNQSWIGLRSIYTSAFDHTGNTKDQEQDQDQQRSVFILGRYFDWGDGSWQWFSVGTRVSYKVKLRYSHSLI